MRTATTVILILIGVSALAMRPYPVRRDAPVAFQLTDDGQTLGEAAISWDDEALVVDCSVKDATPFSLTDAGVDVNEAYRADSVEFWVNRHQFVIVDTAQGVKVWDYLYQQEAKGAVGKAQKTKSGYTLTAMVPWSAIGVKPRVDASFQFALQINDRQRRQSGDAWKDVVKQTFFPQGATFDRPSTYGTIWLSAGSTDNSAPALSRIATVNLRSFAYEKKTECYVQRLAPYEDAELMVEVQGVDGKPFATLPVPAGTGQQRLLLPWDDAHQGIYTAALYLVDEGKRFGPLAEPYFNAGAVPIAQAKSPRQPPADLAEFWAKQVAEMRKRPFDAQVEHLPPKGNMLADKVRITNHRGLPMIVYVCRRKTDTGPLPASLNVYPPMHADGPKLERGGMLGITFCGSRQGECRLPGQTANENLWARADSLDNCYWLDVVLDGVRALDYVASRPDSDGRAMVTGGSRGGWYAMALAAVAPDRVSFARFTSPCYSDVTMSMRLGWSSAASEIYTTFERDRVKTGGRVFATFRYFDPLFLAALIRTPIVFSAGLQDTICSAVGMTEAANAVTYPTHVFVLDPEAGHGGSPWMGGPLADFSLFTKEAP